jgi:hypothetical protein
MPMDGLSKLVIAFATMILFVCAGVMVTLEMNRTALQRALVPISPVSYGINAVLWVWIVLMVLFCIRLAKRNAALSARENQVDTAARLLSHFCRCALCHHACITCKAYG